MMNEENTVRLRRGEERRIQNGHLWVFSNEIGSVSGNPAHGEPVRVVSSTGGHLGWGFFNRNSLISVRIVSRETSLDLREWISRRLGDALRRRERLGLGSVYRLSHGEADFLPGLIIDRYNDTVVIESYSAGMDGMIDFVIQALDSLLSPAHILEKSVSSWRTLEGLPDRIQWHRGQVESIEVAIDGVIYNVNPGSGQKTGIFLDQRFNRSRLGVLAANLSVLDCCCNDGGFALHAAAGGAARVVGVDGSETAVERARINAKANGFGQTEFIQSDIFEYLENTPGNSWDMVIVDPPAFVKSRKKLASGLRGYQKLNERALRVLAPGGIYVTCTCSQLVGQEQFLNTLATAASRAHRGLTIFDVTGASPDHPIHPAMPETRYLTCAWCMTAERV
jgi:23S rRNA (cytosine1962-C5)-methyltransferase